LKKELYIELIVGLGIVVFSSMMVKYSMRIESNASVFPFYISVLLLIFTGVFIIQKTLIIIQKQNSSKEPFIKVQDIGRLDQFKSVVSPMVATLLCLLFIWAFPIIGFEISAFLLMFLIMLSINYKEAISKIWIPLLIPILLILIFRLGLHIRIPLALDILTGN